MVGAARSGLATSEFLLEKGAFVYLNDMKADFLLPKKLKDNKNLTSLFACQPKIKEIKQDLIIVSPAVPLDKDFLQEARQEGIEIIGEIELSYRFAKADFIAITGTNGKTTTSVLIAEIFKKASYETLLGGNIGLPLINRVEELGPEALIVAELSSFQLESIKEFRPKIALMTNLSPDHLDRHKNMTAYLAAKKRIFEKQTEDDFLILNYDDLVIRELASQAKAKVFFFSRKEKLKEGIYLQDGKIILSLDGTEEEIMKVEEIFLKGQHNLENALSAILAARLFAIEASLIRDLLMEFKGVEHRMEYFASYKGVGYVNDSKGTNPDSSIKALLSYNQPLVLLAGGLNKGNSFKEFAQLIKDKCKLVVLLGQAKYEIKEELDKIDYNAYIITETFEEAVEEAIKNSQEGDLVLLSPASASWDMFPDFEVRGKRFKELVKIYNEEKI